MGDRDFRDTMRSMGVKPIDEQSLEPDRVRPDSDEDEDRALFLAALDEGFPRTEPSEQATSTKGPQRLKKIRLKRRTDARLDLHGMTRKDAIPRLHTFIKEHFLEGSRVVEIVTGKGLRSPGGRSVLRPAVEEWLLRKGTRYVDSFAPAPRQAGGRGALIVILRRK